MAAGVAHRAPEGEQMRGREPWEQALIDDPGAHRAATAAFWEQTEPGDPTRRELLMRSLTASWAAAARGDLEVVGLFITDDLDTDWVPVWGSLGFKRVRGREAWESLWSEFLATWESWSNRVDVVIDLGDRIGLLAHGAGVGKASGVPAEMSWGVRLEIAGGMAKSQHAFAEPAELLTACGVNQKALELIEALAPGEWTEIPAELITAPR